LTTLYSDQKITQGGKGLRPVHLLKYFDDLRIDSVYLDGTFKRRSFSMGKGQEIICDEVVAAADKRETGRP
jgi:hypothetical protein